MEMGNMQLVSGAVQSPGSRAGLGSSEPACRDLHPQTAPLRARRLEALGHLTSSVAHDFNNFITAIGGTLSLIEQRSADPDIQRLAHQGNHAVSRSIDLIQMLLAPVRQPAAPPSRTNIHRLFEDIEPLLQHSLPANIVLSIKSEAALCAQEIDPAQLESALFNLTANARHAMPNGGRLSIRARACLADEPGRPYELREAAAMVIEVSDTGCGIAPEILHRVVERYFTTKADQGTGIGLAMVNDFVRRSGGALRIASKPGQGTQVALYLRLAADYLSAGRVSCLSSRRA